MPLRTRLVSFAMHEMSVRTERSESCSLLPRPRFAPLATSMSLSRLELSVAVKGLKLTQSISRLLQMAISGAAFWIDSTNTFWWIRGNGGCFKPFVPYLVAEIQGQTEPVQWRYVRTNLNPADCCTRGLNLIQLAESEFWWHRPSFLKEEQEFWSRNKIGKNYFSSEAKKTVSEETELPYVFASVVTSPIEKTWRLDPKGFSSWTRPERIPTWIYRFLQNCRSPIELRKQGKLSPQEILEAVGRMG